ncbi:hypothetical protein ACWEQ2_29755 [Streptomyces sp. NPDC004096]
MAVGWCSRTLRAAVFAAVCVSLAALGHTMMSGSPLPWWGPAAGVLATGGAGWFLAGRERGLSFVVSAVVVAQAGLHAGFSYAQSGRHLMAPAAMGRGLTPREPMDCADMGPAPTGPRDGPAPMGPMDGMDIGAVMAGADTGPMDPAGLGPAVAAASGGMLMAHLFAAVLCGLWLAYGERATFRILRAVAGRLAAPLRLLLALPAPPERPRVRPRRRRAARSPRRLLLVHSITSRGPPPGTAVL